MKIAGHSRGRFLGSRFLVLLTLLLLLAPPAFAGWISLGGPEGGRIQVEVLESTADRIVIEYTVPGFDATPVAIGGGTYYTLSLPHESARLDAGLPEVPHICRSVIIPDRERMRIRILESETQDLLGMPIAPSKGNLPRTVDPSTVPYRFDPAFYGTDAVYPTALAGMAGAPYIMRDYRGLVVEVSPFQTHAADGRLTVVKRMVVELTPDGPDAVNVIDRAGPPASVTEPFDAIYSSHFINYGMDRYTPVGERGRLLVLCASAFHSAMDPFIEWKNQEGIATTVVDVGTDVPNTTAAIQTRIRDEYLAGNLAYVLLVGDAAQVATPQAAGGASDPTYTLLAGGDRYPEILIGRFSAETIAHVETQVARSVSYEKTPALGQAGNWYAKGTGIGSAEGPGHYGEYDYQHIENIRTDLLGYGYTTVDQIYDPGATAAMVTAALNAGRGIVSYCGHGDVTVWGTTGFSNANVAALLNDGMLPFIFSVACLNGAFSSGTCFGEAWLRSTHNGNPIGAIGTYMSSILQSWNPPMYAEDAFVDLLVAETKHTLGGLTFNASCQMMDDVGQSDGGDMFLTWHVFGDPSLVVRTKPPQPMSVQHDGAIVIGETAYQVRAPLVAGALCSLYNNGVQYGTAYTDLAGNATIILNPPPAEPMTLTLTVTAFNREPAIAPVEVLPPSGPYITFDHFAVIDSTLGDGDGACDSGETGDLFISVKNVGVADATGVTGLLTEDDPYVEIVQGTESQSFGDLPAGGIATSQEAYRLLFAPETPDAHTVSLTLAIHATEGDWQRTFGITIGAPVLAYSGHTADDSPPLGNGTGWISAGEGARISIDLANGGHANARNVSATLVSDNPYVDILTGVGLCPDIPAGEHGTLSGIEIRIRQECPMPAVLTLHADVSADFGYAGTLSFQLSVGGFLDDCEAARGWTIGAPDDNAATGIWVLADPVGTTYGTPPLVVQPEDDNSSDPGTQCYVTGNGTVGGAAGDSDVDGGKTTLLTPTFDLSRVDGATVSYWVWYTNDRGNNPSQDYWVVQVTGDGASWTDLERTTASTDAWVHRSFPIPPNLLTDHVQLRFIADDEPSGSLVEALIDDFSLTVQEPTVDVPDHREPRLELALQGFAPNPATGPAEVRFSVPGRMPIRLCVYDVSGRLVRTLAAGSVEPGAHRVTWDRKNGAGRTVGSGIYFVRMQCPGFTKVRQITLID